MTRKTYRTAQGKMVDLGALQLRNENIRAVGNMGVNARGDVVDGWNKPIDSKNRQVGRQYNRQTKTNVGEDDVSSSHSQKAQAQAKPAKSAKEPRAAKIDIPPPPEDFDDDFEKPVTSTTASTEPVSGLRAAIAKARQIKQDPIEPPPHLRKKTGVNKI
jgi:hypothetical protein